LQDGAYTLATCHRAENTDDPERLTEILRGLATIAQATPVIFPLHPRTRKIIHDRGLQQLIEPLTILEPLAFLDMVALEQSAKLIVTDSGGVQKEAFFYGVPCITARDETEWTETVSLGWNTLVGASHDRMVTAFERGACPDSTARPYGNGKAAEAIV